MELNKQNDKLVDMLIEGLQMWRCEDCTPIEIDCKKCILNEKPIAYDGESYCDILSELWSTLHDYVEKRAERTCK